MLKTLYISRPIILADMEAVRRIDLVDPQPIMAELYKLIGYYDCENIKLDTVVFGVVEYFSLREYARDKCMWSGREDGAGLVIDGVRILMDPRANFTGARAIFDEENAIRVYANHRVSDV